MTVSARERSTSYPEIIHHGAVNGVTGSCHELRLDAERGVLIDCGLFQGAEVSKGGASLQELQIEFPVSHIKALVVTHVHLDHVGRLPYLIAAGFQGPIICSQPSALLLPEVLEDAVRIGFTRNNEVVEKFIGLIRQLIRPIPYGEWHSLEDYGLDGLRLRLHRAGHILGSVYVEFDCPGSSDTVRLSAGRTGGRGRERIIFSGDLGAPHSPLLPAPKAPYGCDRLVIESTYGDQLHEDRRLRKQRLQAVLERALADNGTVLIPAFSIGRTQEILYELEEIIHRNLNNQVAPNLRWKDLAIIVDSPLAARFTELYRELKPFWDAEARRKLRQGRHPLSFEQLITVNDHVDHMRLVSHLAASTRPAVVLAASGMCAGGRVVNYLKAMLGDPKHDILFVGYQAAGTPGRDILTYGPRNGYVELDGERYVIRAKIHKIGGYSAHADQKDLLNFVKRMRNKPREIRIVHGEEGAKRVLQSKLKQLVPGANVFIPHLQD